MGATVRILKLSVHTAADASYTLHTIRLFRHLRHQCVVVVCNIWVDAKDVYVAFPRMDTRLDTLLQETTIGELLSPDQIPAVFSQMACAIRVRSVASIITPKITAPFPSLYIAPA